MFPWGDLFFCVFGENVPNVPKTFVVSHLESGIILFAITLHLKCLKVF